MHPLREARRGGTGQLHPFSGAKDVAEPEPEARVVENDRCGAVQENSWTRADPCNQEGHNPATQHHAHLGEVVWSCGWDSGHHQETAGGMSAPGGDRLCMGEKTTPHADAVLKSVLGRIRMGKNKVMRHVGELWPPAGSMDGSTRSRRQNPTQENSRIQLQEMHIKVTNRGQNT